MDHATIATLNPENAQSTGLSQNVPKLTDSSTSAPRVEQPYPSAKRFKHAKKTVNEITLPLLGIVYRKFVRG